MSPAKLVSASTSQVSHSEDLLHPITRKGRAILQKTGKVPLDLTSHLKMRWNQETLDQITDFLHSGTPESLARVVARNPFAIAHPVLFWQVFHLRQLVRTLDQEGAKAYQELGGSLEPHEQVISPTLKRAARDGLETILKAWVPQVLPGYTVSPVPSRVRRGAKVKWAERDVMDLLYECHDLLGNMKTWPVMGFKRKELETPSSFLERVCALVHRLNETSLRAQDVHWDPPLSSPSHSQNWLIAYKNSKPIKTIIPLSAEVIQKIAQYAIQKKGVSKRRLVCAFLAHFEQTTPKAMERLIERAEGDYPDILKGL